MPALRVLVAEDDANLRDLVSHHLLREGFDVHGAADGNSALRASRNWADFLILDIGLPAIDGFEIARTLRREKRELPIVMLTARTDEVDRIVGLELGADDYVTKPFSPRELIARVKTITRRSGKPYESRPTVLNFGRLEIDEAAREVRVDGARVPLKPREFALLAELANSPGVAISRQTLLEKVWGFDFDGDERTVDVHVRRVRLKVQEQRRLPPVVETVHGFGYKFIRQ